MAEKVDDDDDDDNDDEDDIEEGPLQRETAVDTPLEDVAVDKVDEAGCIGFL